MIFINPTALDLMLQTACDNSVEAGANEVTISVSKINGSPGIHISDNGTGMTDEVKEKFLNSPGFTTKANGCGIGATLIHKVINEHGAKLDLFSDVDIGTELIITFNNTGESHHEEEKTADSR